MACHTYKNSNAAVNLSVSIITKAGKDAVSKDFPVMEHEIEIKTDLYIRQNNSFQKNWQWSIGRLLENG